MRTWLGCGRRIAAMAWWAVAVLGATLAVAAAAELDGVAMPDTLRVDGVALRLNGMGVRTYSLFRVHIYVAGLYLPQPSSNAEAILQSDATKVLTMHFVHDVSAERARTAWQKGFDANCRAPCHLPQDKVRQFLAAVPDFRVGDESMLVFVGHAVQFRVNGHVMGTVDDGDFARTVLANFIGRSPANDPLKHGLLGMSD